MTFDEVKAKVDKDEVKDGVKGSKEEVNEVVQANDHVEMHLDRDPNDPRNRPETNPLPSLNDEGQS